MTIKSWPKQERPREKLLNSNAEVLTDAELLAIFLRTGSRGKTAVDLARELLKSFGSLKALFSADREKLCQTKGIGPAKYVQLQASLELNRRYLFENIKEADVLHSSQATKQYLIAKLGHCKQEIFAGLFLDSKHHILSFKELFKGSIDRAEIYPREIIKIAISLHASKVIFAHNHPSGDPKPSEADINLTKQLQAALALVEIQVLDHIIVGNKKAYSLAEIATPQSLRIP